MNVIQKDKDYTKINVDLRRAIDKAVNRLKTRLSVYRERNLDMRDIHNDNVLIHDVINEDFFVYKSAINRMQLRILYQVKDDDLIIISHYCKNHSNSGINDAWIHYFEKVSTQYMS